MRETEYTPAEVAEICRVKVTTVWDWIKTNKLKAKKQVRQYRILKKDLDEFREKREE